MHEQRPKLYGVRYVASVIRNSSKSHWHRSASRHRTTPWFAGVGPLSIVPLGANWLEQLFRPPQHIPPSFTATWEAEAARLISTGEGAIEPVGTSRAEQAWRAMTQNAPRFTIFITAVLGRRLTLGLTAQCAPVPLMRR